MGTGKTVLSKATLAVQEPQVGCAWHVPEMVRRAAVVQEVGWGRGRSHSGLGWEARAAGVGLGPDFIVVTQRAISLHVS